MRGQRKPPASKGSATGPSDDGLVGILFVLGFAVLAFAAGWIAQVLTGSF